MAVADARMVDDSLEQFRKVLTSHSLGTKFRLSSLMKRLIDLGIDIHDGQEAILRDPFHARLRRVAMNHILRDIKHHARIPLPRSHQLVGIADEGPAYVAAGYQNVFTLQDGQVYGQRPLVLAFTIHGMKDSLHPESW
jgi:RNA-dependent RNA polymerase